MPTIINTWPEDGWTHEQRAQFMRDKIVQLSRDYEKNKQAIISAQNGLDFLLHGDDAEWCKRQKNWGTEPKGWVVPGKIIGDRYDDSE